MEEPAKKIHSLLELAQSLQSVIGKSYTGRYWITAEIARLNFYPKSGHCYPDLVHKEKGMVLAEMRSIIWKDNFIGISKKFQEVVKDELKDGIQILLQGSISYNPKYGISLTIHDIEPSFTLGEMAREKGETIERLKKEGLFNLNRQLPFPILPKRLAVISVSTSKGYHDFLNILKNNSGNFNISHHLFSALLQGDKCAQSISEQLEIIAKHSDEFDAVAIIRGGGGDVGLNAYDNYALAKLVALFPLPVITGIGHSTNLTVVEMVSYANKITPTDVAYFFIEFFIAQQQSLKDWENRLQSRVKTQLHHQREELGSSEMYFSMTIQRLFSHYRNLLAKNRDQIINLSRQRISLQLSELTRYPSRITFAVRQQALINSSKMDSMQNRLITASSQILNQQQQRIAQMKQELHLVNPLQILKRGYSITIHNGKTVTDTTPLITGDHITTIIHHGKIDSTINNISNDKENDNLHDGF